MRSSLLSPTVWLFLLRQAAASLGISESLSSTPSSITFMGSTIPLSYTTVGDSEGTATETVFSYSRPPVTTIRDGTNLGTIAATFTPGPSCSGLTAVLFSIKAQPEVLSYVTPTIGSSWSFLTSTDTLTQGTATATTTDTSLGYYGASVYGAGGAWAAYYENSVVYKAFSSPTTALPALPSLNCYPPGLTKVQTTSQFVILASNYFSPAVSCPSGWEIASQTVTTSSSSASAVTETAALCCRSGWTVETNALSCSSPVTASTLVAQALFTYEAVLSITYTDYTVTMPTFAPTSYVEDIAFQIRWQSTDVTSSLEGTASTTISSPGGSNTTSEGSTLLKLGGIYSRLSRLLLPICVCIMTSLIIIL
jgi:hypothetical protein